MHLGLQAQYLVICNDRSKVRAVLSNIQEPGLALLDHSNTGGACSQIYSKNAANV